MKRLVFLIFLSLINVPRLWSGEVEKAIEVLPSAPFYRYIIYENLVIFWLALIGLLIILRMKLKEINRKQKLGLDEEE